MTTSVYRERQFGLVNWLGFWTLYLKEVRRFIKVYTQTLLAPMATTLLYLIVFLVAMGGAGRTVGGPYEDIPYGDFLAPGLIMMAMGQNAFANTSSSIVIAKVQGNIVDILMPPLSAGELTLAITLGGTTRGLLVGAVLVPVVALFVHVSIWNWAAVLYFGFAASLLLSTLGVLGGLWSEKFDHIAAVTNFIVIPLSFLSGTFYSVAGRSDAWRWLAHADPFFYMIDGFRYGFIGRYDADVLVGALVLAGLNAALLALCWRLFAIGYKIKA